MGTDLHPRKVEMDLPGRLAGEEASFPGEVRNPRRVTIVSMRQGSVFLQVNRIWNNGW